MFLSFHMLLWNGDIKYDGIISNKGSRYSYQAPYSNYWDEVFPILYEHHEHEIYILTGDVGGRPEAISAFYDRCGHIHMIATGMGESPDENFMNVIVNQDGVEYELFPLDEDIEMGELVEDHSFYPFVSSVMSPEGDTTLCAGEEFDLNGEVDEDFDQWWSYNGDYVSDSSHFLATQAGVHSWVTNDGTCSAQACMNIFTAVDPAPFIEFDGVTLLSNYDMADQWYLDGEEISGGEEGWIIPIDEGVYQMFLEVDSCGSIFQ